MWILILTIFLFVIIILVNIGNENTFRENLKKPCLIKVNNTELDICINQNLVREGLNFLIINLMDITEDKEVSFILTKNESLRHGDSYRVCKYVNIEPIAELESEVTHISVLKIPIGDLLPSQGGTRKMNFNINFYRGYPGESKSLFLTDINSSYIYNYHLEYNFQRPGYADNDPELLKSINEEVAEYLVLCRKKTHPF